MDLRRGVRIALNVLLCVMVPVLVLGIAAIGKVRSTLDDILRQGEIGSGALQALNDADGFSTGVGILHFVVLAATATLWAVWFRRVRLNAEVFAPGTHRFGVGWAAGAWFTPAVNLWFPKQIANDIYRASVPPGQKPPKGLLNTWWTLWIASFAVHLLGVVMDRIAAVKLMHVGYFADWEEGARLLKSALVVEGLSSLLLLAAAPFALLVVRQLTRLQEQRFLAGPPAPTVPPYGPPQNPFGAGPAAY